MPPTKLQSNEVTLSTTQQQAVVRLLQTLIDQDAANIIVEPYASEAGFWFGGGNMVEDEDGHLWLVGRYRNVGDSRTGLEMGTRGLECALFRSTNQGETFEKMRAWSKQDLSLTERRVKSIEGTSLHHLPDGTWELLLSSEKETNYPESVQAYQKPGTGIWSIDVMRGDHPSSLASSTLATAIENQAFPGYLHVKDPVSRVDSTGETELFFCSHPFTWSSSNTGLAIRQQQGDAFKVQSWEFVSRGPNWDVAVTRLTDRMDLPSVGVLAGLPHISIYFYDGAECMHELEQNKRGKQRPRGYSCEEIGGAFIQIGNGALTRLSALEPLFVSPRGTGSSRYVSTCRTQNGIWATWQQSQSDKSQPLAGHFLSHDEIERLLS